MQGCLGCNPFNFISQLSEETTLHFWSFIQLEERGMEEQADISQGLVLETHTTEWTKTV